MKWISTKDKLPKDEEAILYHPFKSINGEERFIIFVGWWDDLNNEWVCGWSGMFPPYHDSEVQRFIDDNFRLSKKEITYWMPLPLTPINDKMDERHICIKCLQDSTKAIISNVWIPANQIVPYDEQNVLVKNDKLSQMPIKAYYSEEFKEFISLEGLSTIQGVSVTHWTPIPE